MVLKIEPLDSRKHERSNFCCDRDSLDNYIHKQASQDLKKRVATIFVLIDEPETSPQKLDILAYYTLSNYTIDIDELDNSLAKSLPRYPKLPATLLGRLAVDRTQTGKRFGELMLINAIKKSLQISQQIASLALIAEAIDESAAQFYLKYEFQRFNHQPTRLYLSMKLIALIYQ